MQLVIENELIAQRQSPRLGLVHVSGFGKSRAKDVAVVPVHDRERQRETRGRAQKCPPRDVIFLSQDSGFIQNFGFDPALRVVLRGGIELAVGEHLARHGEFHIRLASSHPVLQTKLVISGFDPKRHDPVPFLKNDFCDALSSRVAHRAGRLIVQDYCIIRKSPPAIRRTSRLTGCMTFGNQIAGAS